MYSPALTVLPLAVRQPRSTRTSSQPATQGKPIPGVTTAAALVTPPRQVSTPTVENVTVKPSRATKTALLL